MFNKHNAMNQFLQHLRVSIFGESHGPAVGITIDGVPAGMPLQASDFVHDMERRKGGVQKGTTPRQEADIPNFMSGVFNHHTTGAPITMLFENANTRSSDYEKQRSIPRPGHADWVAQQKFNGFEDFRGGGHFSGRLTVCLVAAGVIAKKMMPQVSIQAHIKSIAGCNDVEAGLQKAITAKDAVGGIVECVVTGVPVGLGEPFWNSIESLISHAVFAIPAVRGIEFGTGFAAANMFASEHNDVITDAAGTTATNHAGGIVGGITNGNPLVFRIAIKPTSSTPKEQVTYNWVAGTQDTLSVKGRHDLCIALRVPPVLEAVTALVLADAMLATQHIKRIYSPVPIDAKIFHVTTAASWQAAVLSGSYAPESLHTEGFIHCSTADQVSGVLERYYQGVTGLVLLTIDTSQLTAPLRYETAASTGEYFPHVYGRINCNAVITTSAIPDVR